MGGRGDQMTMRKALYAKSKEQKVPQCGRKPVGEEFIPLLLAQCSLLPLYSVRFAYLPRRSSRRKSRG